MVLHRAIEVEVLHLYRWKEEYPPPLPSSSTDEFPHGDDFDALPEPVRLDGEKVAESLVFPGVALIGLSKASCGRVVGGV